MSLIEKAAKRLEELQRSETLLAPGSAPLSEMELPAAGVARPASGLADPMIAAPKRAAPASSLQARAPVTARAEPPLQRVEIDLARMEAQNFVSPGQPHSAIAHEFWNIKKTLLRNASGSDGVRIANGNCIVVTSSLPGEGKTFVATNLAISIAMEYDRKVMLVDGDVVHPSLPGVLGIESGPGLLDLLVRDDLSIDDVLLESNIDGLTILPAGRRDARATELLASAKMTDLLRSLTLRFPDRIIVFDSPPLLPTTEAPVLARLMGQVVMVVGADATPRNVVLQALDLIDDCPVVLMLLNKSRTPMASSYHGYYADAEPQ